MPNRPLARRLLTIALFGSSAGVCVAQPSPADDPALNDPSVKNDERQLERPASGTGEPALTPSPSSGAGAVLPGLSENDLRPARGGLVREGAFLPNRRGRMVPGDHGGWVFIFDADAEGLAEPPMQIQPCQRLTEMQRIVEAKSGTQTFLLSGVAYVFEGANHIMPLMFTTLASEELTTQPATPPPATAGADPSVEELLKSVGSLPAPAARASGSGSGAMSSRGPAPAAGGNDGSKLVREGTMLISRRGRIERGGETGWVFSIESDTDLKAGTTQFSLMRCRNLETIAQLGQSRRAGLVVTLSGTVYSYGGRNFVLPSMFIVEQDREGNLVSGQ